MRQRIALLLTLVTCQAVIAQTSGPGAFVVFDGKPLLQLYSPIGQVTPQDRALLAERRLNELSRDWSVTAQAIQLRERPDATDVYAGARFLFSITEQDSAAAGRPRADLARDYLDRVRRAVDTFRETRSWQALVRGSLYAGLVTVFCLAFLVLLTRLVRSLRGRVFEFRRQGRGAVRFHRAELISARRSAAVILTLLAAVRWVVVLVLLQVYLTVVLGFFPGTAGYAATITTWIMEPVHFIWNSFLEFLPNLFFILVICLATYSLIRMSDFIFREIGEGRITIEGFYHDWAGPTSKLFRALFLVLGTVVVFPYLPGSKSPAFQGISIFLGVLLSLGSTSAVAHAVAGTILTYMRPFQLGDRVKISDIVGDVVERNLLVTRIQTIKNEIITIPNANILNGQIWNYSTSARENNLILHTTVTIGYDVPWRMVHELLVSAAIATDGVRPEPRPFILQTALNDFYVSYQLNVYTADACRMIAICSDLHQNIQDKFNQAGVEIMSPHFAQIRDGNTVTVPESFRPADYQPAGIRFQSVENQTNSASQAG